MKDLTKYNYNDLVEKITALLKDKEGWGDAYQSSLGQTLIQLLADTTDNLHYLLERRSVEGFLHHARLESSVVARASELGYRPYRAKAHTGVVQLTLIDEDDNPTPPVFEAFIPKYTKLTTDGRTFRTLQAVSLRGNQTQVDIPIIEGDYSTKTYPLSDLNEMNEILIEDWKQIDENSIIIKINGNEWKDVRSLDDVNKRALSFTGRNDRMYDIKYTTEGMHIVFGDGWFGAEPTGPITISYIVVSDNPGIYTLGRPFELDRVLRDNQSPSTRYLTKIDNTSIISGGGRSETLDSIRRNATTYNQSNGRGVTNSDYSFWAKRSGVNTIADVRAYGEEEINTYVHNANNVYITYAMEDYGTLPTVDRVRLRNYMDNVKTTQAHLVIRPATVYHLITNTAIRKYANVPISDSHVYYLTRKFLTDRFSVKDGSIGTTLHNSDIINEFYDIKFDDSGITKPLVDFVKWDMQIGIEYSFPSPTRSAMVGIVPNKFESLQAGQEWVILLNEVVCRAVVEPDDNPAKLMLRMRDVIRELTDIEVTTVLQGITIDEGGNFVDVELDPNTGYYSPTSGEGGGTSTIIEPEVVPEDLTITHYYYSPRAGYRPVITIRDTTTVTYAAPTDTDVEVWIKESHLPEDPFDMVELVSAGTTYTETFSDNKLLRFKLVNDSDEDTQVVVHYTSWIGSRLGLQLQHTDSQSYFNITTSSGDFSEDVFIEYHVMATRPPEIIRSGDRLIEPMSVGIYNEVGEIVAIDNGDGTFDVPGGSINYQSGVISPPPETYDGGKYMITYKQDEYSNIQMGRGDVLKLSHIPVDVDEEAIYGSIKIVK